MSNRIDFNAISYAQSGRRVINVVSTFAQVVTIFSVFKEENLYNSAQRSVDEMHVAAIVKYLKTRVGAGRNFSLPAISAVIKNKRNDAKGFERLKAQFIPAAGEEESPTQFGRLVCDMNSVEFRIIDGQHRLKAIEEFLKTHPEYADNGISVVLTPWEGLEEEQGLFLDLNKGKPVNSSVKAIFNHEDSLNVIALRVFRESIFLQKLIDQEGKIQGISPYTRIIKYDNFVSDWVKPILKNFPKDVSQDTIVKVLESVTDKAFRSQQDWKLLAMNFGNPDTTFNAAYHRKTRLGATIVMAALANYTCEVLQRWVLDGDEEMILRNLSNKPWFEAYDPIESIDWRRENPTWKELELLEEDGKLRRRALVIGALSDWLETLLPEESGLEAIAQPVEITEEEIIEACLGTTPEPKEEEVAITATGDDEQEYSVGTPTLGKGDNGYYDTMQVPSEEDTPTPPELKPDPTGIITVGF